MPSTTQTEFNLREPELHDGARIWRLVEESEQLEANSPYSYLLFCTHFRNTAIVAEMENELVGFVTAYLLPDQPDTLFVWQIGVDQRAQGKGLASAMLLQLLLRERCKEVEYLEATITPSNEPSQRLFRSVAKKFKTQCKEEPFFPRECFPGDDHEEEMLFRIGPLRT